MGCHFLLQEIFGSRDRTHVFCVSCFGRHILYHCTAWENPSQNIYSFFFFNCSGFCRTMKWISHGFTCVPIFILHSLVSCCHLTQTPWTLDHLTKRLGMNLKCRSYRKVNTENIIYMWNVNKLIETNNKVMVTRNWGVGEIGRHWSKSMHF